MTQIEYRQYGKFDLTDANDAAIKAGAEWNMTLAYTDANGAAKDLTGYSGYMQIRGVPNGALLADVTVTITGATGEILCALTAAKTLAIGGMSGVYDLFIKSTGTDPVCLLQGNVEILPNVTVIP